MAGKTHQSIENLNNYIERQNTFNNACNYVFEYYIKTNNKTPSIEYLKREMVRLSRWLYKNSQQLWFIEQIRLTLQYLRDISLEVFLEDYNGIGGVIL